MKRFQLILAVAGLLAVSPFTQTAQAGPYIRLGIGIGPGYYYGGPYYYGYPYYYGPRVVVVESPPPTVVIRPGEAVPAPVPAPAPYVAPAPTVIPTQNVAPVSASPRVDGLIQQLSDPSDTVRRDAAMDLGRMKAQKAIDPLINVLSKDASAMARDGAARALGLIAAPRGLNALIYAAQADNDRDVRHSAQFAVEVIRTNLRGN